MLILSMVLLIGLLLFIQRAVYGKYWDSRLNMVISFSTNEAFEGDRLELKEELTNAKPLPLPWVNAKFQISRNLLFPGADNYKVSDYYYQNDMFRIGMYQRVTRIQELICKRRGYYRIRSMDLGSSNLLISSKLIKSIECSAELTVLPRPFPFAELETLYQKLYGDIEVRRFTNPDPFTFRGVRAYDPRDDYRLINFAASAKTGELIVNVHSSTAAQELIILLNVEPYSAYSSEHVIEEGFRIAASAAEHFCEQGYSVGVLSNGREVATGAPVKISAGSGYPHLREILVKLARVDLKLGQDAMWKTLDALYDSEPTYLLVSSNDDQDTARSFKTLRDRGLHVRWIIPSSESMLMRVEENERITRWEVKTIGAVY